MGKTVFTNGCFDIIHPGHIDLLTRARRFGDKLIVGINSDDSVRRIKGASRPVFSQQDRAAILRGLEVVDEVLIFDELTPENLIREIKPDVLIKGGDWKIEEIVGADFVKSYGGEVFSLPLLNDYSTSETISKIQNLNGGQNSEKTRGENEKNSIDDSLNEHLEVIERIIRRDRANIEQCGALILDAIEKGNKILICGNGGSAADAQHLAAEFVGRYETERRALPAVALTTDTSALTALSNDYSFERVFSRQVEALASPGDLLIALSTSGNSPNVVSAVMTARRIGCRILGMTGANGKKLASICDECVSIPSERTARIQEAHILIAHIWCEMIDDKFTNQ